MSGLAWTCDECGQRLRGHWAHCGVCCLTFSGTQPFDDHLLSLVDAGCRTEAQMTKLTNHKTGRPRLSVRELDGVRVWQTYSELPDSDRHDDEFATRMQGAKLGGRP